MRVPNNYKFKKIHVFKFNLDTLKSFLNHENCIFDDALKI